MMEEKKIFASITTTRGSDWRARIKEINELGLKEIALFPTCLSPEERKEMYQLLEKSTIESVPLLHLRNDMPLEELDYFVKNYKTQVLCTHTQSEHPLIYDCSKYKNIISLENVYHTFDEKELKNFGGICLDLSHLENDGILHKERFEDTIKILKKYPILCNHISAIKKFTFIDKTGEIRYDFHYLKDLSELDYLKKYPLNYFSPFIAIELENSIKEQLKVKDYLMKLL